MDATVIALPEPVVIDLDTALVSVKAAAKLAATLLILFILAFNTVFALAKFAAANEFILLIPIMKLL